MLLFAVVLETSADTPKAVLLAPDVFASNAKYPTAVLSLLVTSLNAA